MQRSASSEMLGPAELGTASSEPRADSGPERANASVTDGKAPPNPLEVSEDDTESDSEDEEEEDTAAMMPVDDHSPPNFRERVDLGHASAHEVDSNGNSAEQGQSLETKRPGESEPADGSDSEMSSEEHADSVVGDNEEEGETEDEDEYDDEEEEP